MVLPTSAAATDGWTADHRLSARSDVYRETGQVSRATEEVQGMTTVVLTSTEEEPGWTSEVGRDGRVVVWDVDIGSSGGVA